MKVTSTIILILAAVFVLSCNEKAPSARQQPVTGTPAPDASAATSPAPATTAAGLMHYTCPNNCAGSGGDSAGNCPTCGTAYVHNAAFHVQQINEQAQVTTQTAAPTLNAASSAFHYTCPNGCAGGGAAAGNCATCGTALAHNAAYHTQNQSQPVAAPGGKSPVFLQAPQATPQATTPTLNAGSSGYHYTCPNGCAGGASAAGNCASCGTALAHNAAYHQ